MQKKKEKHHQAVDQGTYPARSPAKAVHFQYRAIESGGYFWLLLPTIHLNAQTDDQNA